MRSFAATYPDEVAGLVLVELHRESLGPGVAAEAGLVASVVEHISALVSTTARLGVGRLIALTGFSDLPAEVSRRGSLEHRRRHGDVQLPRRVRRGESLRE